MDEVFEHGVAAGHGLGADDVRTADAGALGGGGVAPGFLGAEPEGESGNLDGAGVDVDAVDVVLDDEARDVAEVVGFFGVGFLEGGTVAFVPGFLVDGLEEVEGSVNRPGASPRAEADASLTEASRTRQTLYAVAGLPWAKE